MPNVSKEIGNNFSQRALNTLEAASVIAGQMGASQVSTEQVILALTRSSLEPVFTALKIDEEYFRSTMPQPDKTPYPGKVRFSGEVDELAHRAIELASRRKPGKADDMDILEAVLDSPMVIEAYLIKRSIKPDGSMMRASFTDCLWRTAVYFNKHPKKFNSSIQRAA